MSGVIEESARVVAEDGDHVWVEAQRRSSCGGCSARAGCGTGSLSQALARRTIRLRALNRAHARAGEAVVIGLREDALVRGSLAVYLAPLVLMIGSGVLGEAVVARLGYVAADLWAASAGLLGLVAGLLWVARFSRAIKTDRRYEPIVLRREPAAAVRIDFNNNPIDRSV